MKRNALACSGGVVELGSIVKWNMAEVGCTKVDKKTLTFVVVDKEESKGSHPHMYRLANKGGVLGHWIM